MRIPSGTNLHTARINYKPGIKSCSCNKHSIYGDTQEIRSPDRPVRQPCHRFYHRQDCKQRLGVLERRAHLVPVCTRYLLVSLRIIPDADGAYRLQSKSDSDRSYRVTATSCQCKGFKIYGNRNPDNMPTCSHIEAVKIVKGTSS